MAPALAIVCSLMSTSAHAAAPLSAKSACGARRVSFDDGWRFSRGEQTGAEQQTFDDRAWKAVSTPHDWAIEGPFAPKNPSLGQGAFAPMGVGWYRKRFAVPAACEGRTVVQFDGVMANSDAWINGHLLGHRPSGYSTFRYDLTPFLQHGAEQNVLSVRADNAQQPSSRFYQGAGIYRHVHLLHLASLHIADWSVAVTTSHVSTEAATILVRAEARNQGAATSRTGMAVSLVDASGKLVGHATAPSQAINAGATKPYFVTLELKHPLLWDIAHPAMYAARVQLLDGRRPGDVEEVAFGVRDAHFEADTGFWLNGRNLKIKGVALHSDIGALGMAAPMSLWEHRLRAMQGMGANAIRTAHNEVAPELLDLCDRLGLLVLDEYFDVWTVAKNPYDYHLYFRDWFLRDTHDGVLRDRNHPSVIAWSAGNEIHDTPHPEIARPILAALVEQYHKDDPSRPVTQALFRPNVSHDYGNGLADLLDVVGQNYRPNEILAAHDEKPSRKILGTENGHDRATWLAVRDHPPYAGLFIWSGTDYLGESRRWPLIGDASGLFDRTGFPKPDALEFESWWAEHPVVHVVRRVAPTQKAPTDPGYEAEQYRPRQVVFADWTPENMAPHNERVEVYSNCAEVSLRLNGVLLGGQPLAADAAPRTWDVPFAPGTLEARCDDRDNTREVLRTAAAPAGILLREETGGLGNGFDRVALVRATVVDRDGIAVPSATVALRFNVNGPAVVLATDNADNAYTSPFREPVRSSYQGRAVVMLRATEPTGAIRLEATSPGLRAGELELRIERN